MSESRDVRMRGFLNRTPVATVQERIAARCPALTLELIPVTEAAGRVLSRAAQSRVNIPAFERAAMDGFALQAANTPGVCRLVGDAFPARPFDGVVEAGQAVRIMTGAAIPAGADTIVMAEQAVATHDQVRVNDRTPPGKHIIRVGEDIAAGQTVLAPGRILRAQDIGLLAALGEATVPVVRQPRVAILVTGDELLPPGNVPRGVQIVDCNSPMLQALVQRDSGLVPAVEYVADTHNAIRDALNTTKADVVLVSGGSSVGTEDHAPRVLAELGTLDVHGIAVRPGAPAGWGFFAGKLVFLLPGNPVACLCAYDLFAGRAVRALGGRPAGLPYRSTWVPATVDLHSAVGRVDYVRVRRTGNAVEPLRGGASLLSTIVAADGFTLIDDATATLPASLPIRVWWYDALGADE